LSTSHTLRAPYNPVVRGVNTLDRGFEAGIADLTPGRCAVDMLVVRRRGHLNAELDEPGADRLDTPSQTAGAAAALMLTDEANDQLLWPVQFGREESRRSLQNCFGYLRPTSFRR